MLTCNKSLGTAPELKIDLSFFRKQRASKCLEHTREPFASQFRRRPIAVIHDARKASSLGNLKTFISMNNEEENL